MGVEGKEVNRTRVNIADLGPLIEGDRVRLPDGKGTGSIVKICDERRVQPGLFSEYLCKVQRTNEEVVVAWLSRPDHLIQ